jgi:hypothetical protein
MLSLANTALLSTQHRFYGAVSGLTNASCSGRCEDGALCEPGSTQSTGVPCPTGSWCTQGIAVPCPAGTYNGGMGASSRQLCTPCPANTYSAVNGSTSVALCVPCSAFEGSLPGAAACWPGLIGE